MARRTEHRFTIEREQEAGSIEDAQIAVVGSIRFARAVFELATACFPGDRLILCHGARIIARYEPG